MAAVRLLPTAAAALCLRLCLCAAEPTVRQRAVGEYALLVGRPSVFAYSPLDSGASARPLLNDTGAVPDYASCAHFNASVYCVGGRSVDTWRFSRVDGSPLPPGPDLNRDMKWPGNGRMANINDEWLVTCGDSRLFYPNTCQVLHVNASQWVQVESESCHLPAVAEHGGSVFAVGGFCVGGCGGLGTRSRYLDSRRTVRSASAAVWSLRVSRTAVGSDTFQWQRQPDMNTPREDLAIASHNGHLYACGGWGRRRPVAALSDCERWREGMDGWQSIAPMPEARTRLHMLSVHGRLIAMGGYGIRGKKYKRDVFVYDEAEDTWSRLHDMPHMHWFGSAVVPTL